MSKGMTQENSDSFEEECFRLLKSLKQTVEWLLTSYSPNVWNTYGSLPRLCSIVDEILSHGLLYEGPQKYWQYLCGLRFLKPELGPPILPFEVQGISDPEQESQLCQQWVKKSLLEHNMSVQLQMLIQDEQHTLHFYKRSAFLLNKSCTDALLICLRAVEHNQPALLADLDPALVMKMLSQSQMLLNAAISIQNVRKEARQICDNIKEVFETSSSLDYMTPPESTADLNYLLNNQTPHTNLISQSLCETADVNGNHLNDNIVQQITQCDNILIQEDHNLNENSQIHIFKNSSYRLTDDCAVSTVFDCKTFMPSNNSSKICSLLSTPATNIDSSDCSLKRISGKSLHIYRCVSSPVLSDRCSEIVHKRFSLPNLPTNITLYNGSTPARSERSSFISLGSSVDMEWQVISDSLTVCDISSYVKKHSKVRDQENSNLPLDSAVEATEANLVNVSSSTWKAQHSRSRSDGTAPFQNGICIDEPEISTDMALSSSLPSIFPDDEKEKPKSIFEGDQVVVSTECFFPRPRPGQTLKSFLSSNDFNICAELDKENAHFCIAEALIAAIEQIKCTQTVKLAVEDVESDEEIKTLTQRIRIRRREKMREKEIKNLAFLSDGKTDTTTSQSASPKSSSHSSDFGDGESIGSDDEDIEDIELSDRTESNLSSVKESGLSLSMASLYSDADFKKMSTYPTPIIADVDEKKLFTENNTNLSAEAIALSLLKRFSEKQLPKASDLEWLVSEQDAPQRLLPLPDSWPVSPDSTDEDYNLDKTRLRGNLEWAPPRRQIIFIIHPDPKRKVAIQKQNYRCAGCGMKIEKNYIKKFRYCEYLGKFFCQCCHSNNLSYIPGRILWKWDFKHYYVCKFAWKLLDQMFSDPLFNVLDVNPNLYRKVRQLDMCREYRMQLFYLKDYIKTCRNAEKIQNELVRISHYVINEPDKYSLSDFVQVKNGEFSRYLSSLVSRCTSHVMQCDLCRARGFICEMCDKHKDIIFPFQLSKVCHCPECGSCFHKKCYKPGICPKCIRIKERKRKLLEQEKVQNND